MEALIDTGATISVISADMFKHLGNLHRQNTDKSDVCMCTLANGTEINIKQKSMIDITVDTMKLTAKLYILPQAHIELIIGCDILSHVGAVIDFTKNELSLLRKGDDKTVDSINNVNIGYLGGLTERTVDPIVFAPSSSQIIEPKSSKRILIYGTEHVIPKYIFNQEVTVNDCLSLQLQGNYHYDDKVSELGDGCQK